MRTSAEHFVKMKVGQISVTVVAMPYQNPAFGFLSRLVPPMRPEGLSLLFARSASSVYLRSAKAAKRWIVDWRLMKI